MRAGADGVIVAAPIWNQFMREALKETRPEQFSEPPGIQHVVVDSVSGKLPTEFTPSTKTEVFASFALPKDFDDVHVPVSINKLNGKVASSLTPADLLETRVYTVIRSEMPNNPKWEAPVVDWARSNGYNYPPTEPDDGSVNPELVENQVRFITPANNQTLSNLPFVAQVEVSGMSAVLIELILEGEYLGSKTASPYSFTIQSAKNGWQTLTAVVHLVNGESIQNSIRINVDAGTVPAPTPVP
jgi:membrane carboxypeptidase/penicillin-binding protein PbpC